MADPARRRRSPWRRSTFLATWVVASFIFLALSGLYTLATPIPSGPDEPTHYVKAAAVANGTLTGEHRPGSARGTVLVHVRGTFVMYNPRSGCYYLHAEVPAGCAPSPGTNDKVRATTTYVGEYPPLYYALTGLPSLVSGQPVSRWAMRAVSALLSAVLLGLAMSAAVTWSRSRWMVLGVAFTVTPTAVYLASVLNPSGLEISAAIATWTAGALLLFEHADDPPPGLVAVFAASSVVLAATRPLSPLWAAGIIVALVALRPAAAGRLLRSGAVRVGVAVTAVAVAAATAYVVVNDSLAVERFPLPPGFSNQQVAALVLGLIPEHALSLVGRFGGPEFGAPALAVLVWVVGVGALVCVAVSVGDRWQAAVLALIVLATLVALPFAASFPDARSRGVTWQGRYQYPLAAGVPLVAVAVLGAARTRMGRAGSIAAGAVVIGHLATFYWVLRRYTVGLGPSVNAFARVPRGWEPPLPAPLLAALVVVTASAYGAWLAARLARPLPLEAERWASE